MAKYSFYQLLAQGAIPEEGRPAAVHIILRDEHLRTVGPMSFEAARKLGVEPLDMVGNAALEMAQVAGMEREAAIAERDEARDKAAEAERQRDRAIYAATVNADYAKVMESERDTIAARHDGLAVQVRELQEANALQALARAAK